MLYCTLVYMYIDQGHEMSPRLTMTYYGNNCKETLDPQSETLGEKRFLKF